RPARLSRTPPPGDATILASHRCGLSRSCNADDGAVALPHPSRSRRHPLDRQAPPGPRLGGDLRHPVRAPAVRPPAGTGPAPAPAPGQYFGWNGDTSTLPSDAQCAAAVRRGQPEIRPNNTPYNNTPGSASTTQWPRVTGNFTGTTDEIIQWGACKWGFDE